MTAYQKKSAAIIGGIIAVMAALHLLEALLS